MELDHESDSEADDEAMPWAAPSPRPSPDALARIYKIPAFLLQEEENTCFERMARVYGGLLTRADLIYCSLYESSSNAMAPIFTVDLTRYSVIDTYHDWLIRCNVACPSPLRHGSGGSSRLRELPEHTR